MQYRKKPVVIEAVQWCGNWDEVVEFIRSAYPSGEAISLDGKGINLTIETLEGTMTCSLGDWIIRGIKGEYYPCKSDIFEATYEQVE